MMGIPICLFFKPTIPSTQQSHSLLLLELHCCVVGHSPHPDFQTLLRLGSLKTPLITEWLRLEMTSGDPPHLVQMPLLKQGHLQLAAHDHVQLVF